MAPVAGGSGGGGIGGIGGIGSSSSGGGRDGVGGGIGRNGRRKRMALDDADTLTPATTICYFMDKLPAELRIKIYGFIFGPSQHARLITSPVLAQTAKICPVHRFATVPVRTQCCRVTACHGCIADDDHQCPRCRQPVSVDLMDLRSTFTSGEERRDVERLILKRRQGKTLIPTSILAVNKKIYAEAMEKFYDDKIIKVTFHQLSLMLDFRKMRTSTQITMVKKIQILKIMDQHQRDELVQDALDGAMELPRLISVTIVTDSIARLQEEDTEARDLTVRGWANSKNLGSVTCTDIGQYRLGGKLDKVYFSHIKLRKLWPTVLDITPEFNAAQEAQDVIANWALKRNYFRPQLIVWASQTSFKIWVGLYEQVRSFRDDVPDEQEEDVEIFWSTVYRFRTEAADAAVPLHLLGTHSDPNMLEDATEMLAANFARYLALEEANGGGLAEMVLEQEWEELVGPRFP